MRTMNSHPARSLIISGGKGNARIRQGPSGVWIVQDDAQRRGGLFRDRKDAVAFAREEFDETG